MGTALGWEGYRLIVRRTDGDPLTHSNTILSSLVQLLSTEKEMGTSGNEKHPHEFTFYP